MPAGMQANVEGCAQPSIMPVVHKRVCDVVCQEALSTCIVDQDVNGLISGLELAYKAADLLKAAHIQLHELDLIGAEGRIDSVCCPANAQQLYKRRH